MTIIIYSVHNHQKRSVRKREKCTSFTQHGKEWLQIRLRFRKAEDDTKAFVFALYNCRTCFLIQWQFIAVFTTVSFRLQQFSQNYWQQCKISDKLVGELLTTPNRGKQICIRLCLQRRSANHTNCLTLTIPRFLLQ